MFTCLIILIKFLTNCKLKKDTNSTIATNGYSVKWSSATSTKTNPYPYYLYMQIDGNLVLYDQLSASVWASNTANTGYKGRRIELTDDGKINLVDGLNRVVWTT